MPRCFHPSCNRDDLPIAPAFPLQSAVAVAHVNAKSEPCPFATTETYDLEALTTIVTESKLWDIGADEPDEDVAPAAVVKAQPPPDPVAAFLAKRSRQNADTTPTQSTETPAPPPAPAKPAAQGRKKKAPRGKSEDVDDWDPGA